ncbi:MAG: DegT/DnrJ/EryC1/StrS family aminotransferase [Lachnospiraceae bacterium]|nr:DegT/DnrJ/EryC1/StrS family aminotransferase [Lachnospiraceae bacterium]
MDFINQMEPTIDEREKKAMNEYLSSGGWLMEFKQTRNLENMIADFTGAKYCLMMPNGTLSLSVALMACGVCAGDEVIVPDYTMVATANAAELIGAKAVFADVARENLCMDYHAMVSAITPKTKAVIIVSMNGRYPDNIQKYINFCKERGLYIIEDAAQALGSRKNGVQIGRYGDIGSFSFSVPKIITTGQGGALITDDENLYNKIRLIRDFGREKGGSDNYLVKGWNFKFTDLQAVIGIEQMKKLPERIKRKKEMEELYRKLLADVKEIEWIKKNDKDELLWFFEILCEKREALQRYLKENGIGSRESYPPLHSEPAYGYNEKYPVTEEITQKVLWLPSTITLTDDQICYICSKIKQFYSGANDE